jgi:hypothetical protein
LADGQVQKRADLKMAFGQTIKSRNFNQRKLKLELQHKLKLELQRAYAPVGAVSS